MKILIFVKSIDGGTGTNVIALQDLPGVFPRQRVKLKTLVLEEPRYRKIMPHSFVFFHPQNTYAESYRFSLRNVFRFLRELLWLKKQVKHWQPDIILSVDIHCNLLSLLCKRLFCRRVKIVATTHINLAQTLADKSSGIARLLLTKSVAYFYNQADALVCVSRKLAQTLARDFNLKRKVITIYNGLFPKNIARPRQMRQGKKILITLGRLVEQKDHLTLIQAFHLLQSEELDSELWIVSDGPLKPQLIKLVKKLGLDSKVIFHGWVADIYRYLAQADVFVLSSRREGFAYVLIEAMSQGLPIISTDTPYGPAEVLDKGRYGVLVPVGNAPALKDALLKILRDGRLYARYSAKSLARAQFFSKAKMLNGYKKIIRRLWLV